MIKALHFSIDASYYVPMNPAVEAQLHHDYPFLDQADTAESFVIRRYLETLWLPESLNPLPHLISSLRRIQFPGSSDQKATAVHPLHALLEPLLLPCRAASEKYRSELVHILVDGGGAGEQEEQMMWYAWNYEKGGELTSEGDEEEWRKRWLERLERRETMIQILLNMLKLSLPGPHPVPATEEDARKPRKKRKRSKQADQPLATETDEERVENYMDKMSMWQLTASLDPSTAKHMASSKGEEKVERDWTQAFCEDIVEPLFKTLLPEQCTLLRSKVFPETFATDTEKSDAETIFDSKSRSSSRAPSASRRPSPLPPDLPSTSRASSRAPSVALSEAATDSSRSLNRSRSRSLSVSLMQDEEANKRSIVEPRHGIRRALSREVSMSRTFKPKPKEERRAAGTRQLKRTESTASKAKIDMGTTLVADTPIRPRATTYSQAGISQSFFVPVLSPPLTSSPGGAIFIEDTPEKPKARVMQTQLNVPQGEASPLSPLPSLTSTPARDSSNSQPGLSESSMQRHIHADEDVDSWLDENADDSFTGSFGSPDILLLSGDGKIKFTQSPRSSSPAMGEQSPSPMLRKIGLRSARNALAGDAGVNTPTKKRKTRNP